MTCPRCKHANAPERNFCGSCGHGLALYCAVCGFRNAAADAYCGGCGRLLAAEAAVRPSGGAQPAAGAPAESTDGLSELLEAAREEAPAAAADPNARVNQDDIDALFQD